MRIVFWAVIFQVTLGAYHAYSQQVQPAVDSMAFYNNTKKLAIGNPKFIEYAPTIQADGKTIIFQSNEGKKYDLYQTHRENSAWGKSIALD